MLLRLLLLVFLIFPAASSSSANLKSVHVVFRHGDSVHETPAFYPLDPKAPHDYDPDVRSKLSSTGQLRSLHLGEYLQERYIEFLGKEYGSKDVYARSTYTMRAQDSLRILLDNLHPGCPNEKSSTPCTQTDDPVIIESPEGGQYDPLMWPIDCPTYQEEREMQENKTDFMQENIRFFVDQFKRTGPKSDFSEAELKNIYTKLIGKLRVYDKAIPDWTEVPAEVTERFAHDVAFLRYRAQNYNKKLIRLNGGMLLRKIMDDMQRKKEGEDHLPKMYLYGGHEFNVVALLYALDAWKPIVPTYGSAVILELLEEQEQYYVKVFYRDTVCDEIEERTIVGCPLNNSAEMCLYDDLYDLLQYKETLPDSNSECYPCSISNEKRDHCSMKKRREFLK